MELDYEAAEAKKTSLEVFATNLAFSSKLSRSKDIKHLVDAFVQVRPPEKPQIVVELITINSSSNRSRARSHKPGNLLLNWRRLIEIVPDVALTTVGVSSLPPWTLPLVGLHIWNKVWNGVTEEFSDLEATVILVLWKNCNREKKIDEEIGFEKINALRQSYNLPLVTREEFVVTVDRLVKVKCIELESGVIWLREWVRVSYG